MVTLIVRVTVKVKSVSKEVTVLFDSDRETVLREMPRYKCHKEVYALKIADIRQSTSMRFVDTDEVDDGGIIVPADEDYESFRVDKEYMLKHNPEPGGYYVVYDDGYKSFSPAEAFENGYTLIS